MKIKDAFEKHACRSGNTQSPATFIALRHAMKNYLGRDVGLAAVIRAVVDGNLVPVGYTKRFPGITGYLVPVRRSPQVPAGVRHRSAPGRLPQLQGGGGRVGGKSACDSRPREQNIVRAAADYRFGLSKLVPAADVQRFAERYVATSVLAKRFRLNSGSLARYLKESGTPLLVIPIPDAGRGHAFFLRKDVAAQIQIPSPRMLREQHSAASWPLGRSTGPSTGKRGKPPWTNLCDESG